MKVRKVAALGLISAISSGASAYCSGGDPTSPIYRPGYYSVRQEFARSKFVIEAVAEKETWLGEDGRPKPLKPPFQFGGDRPFGFDPYMGAYFDVRVRSAFKGKPPARLRLFSENSTGRFYLKPGRTFLLFVTEAEFDLPIRRALTIDNCGNSDSANKRSLLRQVRSLARR